MKPVRPQLSRRHFLRSTGNGFGMVALTAMLEGDGLLGAPVSNLKSSISNPLAPQRSHFPAKAKSVIFLFMSGGPSHVDLFDPKPDLVRLAGQPIPESFGTFKTRRAVAKNTLMPPLRPFAKHGECSMEVSGLCRTWRSPWMTFVCCAAATATDIAQAFLKSSPFGEFCWALHNLNEFVYAE